ncbi:MAG: glycosyltransferase [Candidatus Woesearchaeota archaeon]
MRVAILVDALVNKGGVERIVLQQAKLFNADLYVGRFSENTFEEFKNFNIIKITKTYNVYSRLHTLYLWYKFSKLNLQGKYDLFIIHGASALNSARKNNPNLWYCHSPSRYLYDLHQEEYKKLQFPKNLLFKFITNIQRRIDQKNVSFIDKIVVNSNNVKERVKKFYNRESEILYPFVETKKFKFISQENFYLSTARLDKIKRVDLIIKAFLKMPDKKLIIASDGPEKKNLIKLCKNSKNITFLGYVSEEKLRELYGKCIATLYLSYKEDFGIIPIESMAAGKPCIATNDGGFKETIIHKKTGFLVDQPENTENVIKAINYMTKKRCLEMRKDCEKQAKKFDINVFNKKHFEIVNNLLNTLKNNF